MLAKSKELTEYQLATGNLKRRLREKGITYRGLAKSVGLSESGVKKSSSPKTALSSAWLSWRSTRVSL